MILDPDDQLNQYHLKMFEKKHEGHSLITTDITEVKHEYERIFANLRREDMDFNPEDHILPCPFYINCILPKNDTLCNFPEYKFCSDYQKMFTELKTTKPIELLKY